MRASFLGNTGIGIVAVAIAIVGCRGRPQTEVREADNTAQTRGSEQPATPPAAGWPRVLVIGPGTGQPALYLGAEQDAPAIGYLNAGVRVRLESGPRGDRVQVLVGGPLPTKAWVPMSRVALFAQQRGRVEGTRTYVGAGDMVSVLGPATEGQMRVEVRPWLGGTTYLDPQVGTYATAQLADHAPTGTLEQPTAGECFRLPAGQTTPVYDRPEGRAVAQLPAQSPGATIVVLRHQGEWSGMRAGYGPYLTGYVQGTLTPCEGARPDPTPAAQHGENGTPYWMTQERGPLYRVASGTAVRFNRRTIARLRAEGWARELGRQPGDLVDVFIAVDDGVAIRGLVESSTLTLVSGAQGTAPGTTQGTQGTAPTPTGPPEPQEPLPDELE